MPGYFFQNFSSITPKRYCDWLARIPEFRRWKALKYRRYEDSLLSVVSYLLLCQAIGATAEMPEFSYHSHGKPFLTDPGRYEKPFFNLSHTAQFAVCALSEYEIGVDAQEMIDWDPDLARTICSDSEYRLLERVEGHPVDQVRLLTRLWTLKESYLKASGVGLSEVPAKIDFSPVLTDDLFCERIAAMDRVFQIREFSRITLTVCRYPASEAIAWRCLSVGELDPLKGEIDMNTDGENEENTSVTVNQ